MNRRGALITLGLTAFGGVAWSLTRPRLLLSKLAPASLVASGTPDAKQDGLVQDRLTQDLARRSQRINSEEGIAMFLVCENLVPDTSSHAPAKVALTRLNAALAAAMQRNAAAWLRIHPDAQYKDVAQIIEVMADRDFTHGGSVEAQ